MATLTVAEVYERLRDLEKIAESGDDESAHCAEDELHCYVLSAIAEGRCEDAPGCAKAALTSDKIDFYRWYA